MYRLRQGDKRKKKRVQLLSCGTILREAMAAADMLESDYKVAVDVWSVTSFTELRRDGLDCDRWNLLHPDETPRDPYVTKQLAQVDAPVITATDYMKTYGDLIRPWVPQTYNVLGTDGFGRSDTREALRDFFEVDRRWITLAALQSLVKDGVLEQKVLTKAIQDLNINPDKPNPVTV